MVTFIAPSFQEEYDPYVFIGSLLSQKNPNWKAIIYNNGPNPWLRRVIDETQTPKLRYIPWLKELVASLDDKRISYLESATNTGGWGCYNRSDAIQNHVETEYVVQTSIQDYWLPNTVDLIAQYCGADFIYWDSINHLCGYHNVLHTLPVINYIDWGNFAVKTSIARKVGIRHPESFTADGLFVRDCIAEGLILKPVKIRQILTIHN